MKRSQSGSTAFQSDQNKKQICWINSVTQNNTFVTKKKEEPQHAQMNRFGMISKTTIVCACVRAPVYVYARSGEFLNVIY